jgi:hypothetical protein
MLIATYTSFLQSHSQARGTFLLAAFPRFYVAKPLLLCRCC